MITIRGLSLTAAVTLLCTAVAFAASPDVSLLKKGKTWTGMISGFPIHKAIHVPPKQDVTLHLENVSSAFAKVQISWSKMYDGAGDSGSEACEAQISEEDGLPKLSCKTNKGNYGWEFIFHPDGKVHCRLDVLARGVNRTGYLK